MPALRAFIVEDSPVILENLMDTLEELANVEVVGSVGDEAAAVNWMLQDPQHGADLFIVDVFLRSGTGLGVLQAAQRLGVTARRVVLTNYATDDMRDRCASLGAERVFDKSQQLEELINYCAVLSETLMGQSGAELQASDVQAPRQPALAPDGPATAK